MLISPSVVFPTLGGCGLYADSLSLLWAAADHGAYWYCATAEYIMTPAATAAARAAKVVAQISTERSL